VYLARELKHDRLVAMKVLHPALVSSLQGERFLREVGILAGLAHPHILPLLDSGRVGDVLYFTMPYVEGETLRERLYTAGRLSVDETVQLVREAASALGYAHRRGLVHRDIKPENILLAENHALVADFGIARAMSRAVEERLTSGLPPGTPHYMSPEQAGGSEEVGPRSDIYSLGCVLFELLTGKPPYDGEALQDVLHQHLFAPVPRPSEQRDGIPAHIEQAVLRALAKRSQERFDTADDFAAAISTSSGQWNLFPRPSARTLRRILVVGLTAVTGLAALVTSVRVAATPEVLSWPRRVGLAIGLGRLALDTATFVVAPSDASQETLRVTALMRASLGSWREITVENATQTERAAGVDGSISAVGVQRAAIALRAGRFVRVSATTDRDTIAVTARLYDTRSRDALGVRSIRVGVSAGLSGLARNLADSLLFLTGVPADRSDGPAGTASLAARRLYFQGHAELARGEFRRADSSFDAAVRFDPDYPQALIWLGTLRSWSDATPAAWHDLPGRARRREADLSSRDSSVLEGLSRLANGDLVAACQTWTHLTETSPFDFAVWYGLGRCLQRDNTVVRDRSRPEGWRFRSSYHATVRAYERAFRLRPALLRAYGGRALSELRQLLMTGGGQVRSGFSHLPDSQQFTGYPIWSGDSLIVAPLTRAGALRGPQSEAFAQAIERQRLRFRDVASLWKAEFPRSADAVEAYAIALEMLGDPASLDTIERARSLAQDDAARERITANAILMRLKFSAPDNLVGIRQARTLADSLLRATSPTRSAAPRLLAAIASMIGRATLAADYSRVEDNELIGPALLRDGPALLAFAAHGGPRDSIAALESAVETALLSMPSSSQRSARANFLIRAAVLAFPEVSLRTLPDTGPTSLRAGDLVASALRRDTANVRAIIDQIAADRRWARPADKSPDALLPEAIALERIGDLVAAEAWIGPTLQSLRFVASQDLSTTTRVAPLIRLMVLQADLAGHRGDRLTAARWAACVHALWSGADPFLQPVVRRMGEFIQ
jgi:tetratricopeptide (TPR) repeat protein